MATRPYRHLVLCLCTLAFGAAAQAQVVRCTDARTGKVTYTDGGCASGSATHEVEARKTPQELQQEREQAAHALERKQQRLQAEAETEQAQAQRNAERARAAQAATAPQTPDYARSAECARSRRQLDIVASGLPRTPYEQDARLDAAQRQVDLDCLGPQGYAEVQKARAQQPRVVLVPPPARPFSHTAPPAQPRRLTECGDWRCTDNQGQTYPRTGPGRFPGPGGVCRSNGGQAPC